MLEGSPNEFLHKPIVKYLEDRGVKIHLNRRVQELHYTTDASGVPTAVQGFTVNAGKGEKEERRDYDVVVAATDVPGKPDLF